jgi:uncharacterized membrane protein (UPF0127 family)
MPRHLLINGMPLRLWVADEFITRARGLLGRKLAVGEGLLITPCGAVHTFGMGYPIDVMFLDDHHRILKIVPNLAPWRVATCRGSRAVLELPAGQARQLGLMVKQRLNLGSTAAAGVDRRRGSTR